MATLHFMWTSYKLLTGICSTGLSSQKIVSGEKSGMKGVRNMTGMLGAATDQMDRKTV